MNQRMKMSSQQEAELTMAALMAQGKSLVMGYDKDSGRFVIKTVEIGREE